MVVVVVVDIRVKLPTLALPLSRASGPDPRQADAEDMHGGFRFLLQCSSGNAG